MASLDEEDLWEGKEGGSSLDGYGTPSANEYDEDSPILVSASAGDAAGLGEPFGVDDGAYGALGWNRVKGEEAVDLKEQVLLLIVVVVRCVLCFLVDFHNLSWLNWCIKS